MATRSNILNLGGVRAHKGIIHPTPFYYSSPAAADSYPVFFAPYDLIMLGVWAETDTGTVTFNLERRAYGSADSAGTDILTSDLAADSTGESTQDFSRPLIVAPSWISLAVTSVASSPTKLWLGLALGIR